MTILAIVRNDLRILRRDPFPLIVLVLMPLMVIPFVESALRLTLLAEGIADANGAEQAVPGMAVLFGFFLASQVAFGMLTEHAWHTWDRLRASPASTGEILVGKIVVPLLAAAMQFGVLFVLGGLLFALRVRESWAQLAAVGGTFSLCVVALGVVVAAVCRSLIEVNIVINVSAMLIAGLGGALVPEAFLPHWARIIAPAVPSYWAMVGYRHAIIGGHGGIAAPIGVLLGYTVIFAAIACWQLRFGDRKSGFS
jgi:ABC-2 type transport system permease protein